MHCTSQMSKVLPECGEHESCELSVKGPITMAQLEVPSVERMFGMVGAV